VTVTATEEANQDITSVLREQRSFAPPPGFAAGARLKARDIDQLRRRAAADYTGFWADLARAHLHWHRPFTQVLDESSAPNYRWFADGELNVSYNCLDAHLERQGDKRALIFEGEPGDTRTLSYRELHAQVCRFANVLKDLGARRGDRIVIYMPMIPETVIAMQACARIGAIHSVVFGGFSAVSLRDRIEDAGATLVITADGGWRGGQSVPLKNAVDQALAEGCPSVTGVVVVRRTQAAISMQDQRDRWWHELMQNASPNCEPEWVGAEHPLYLLYTSGSTGKPKGIQHSSAGYLLNARLSYEWVFDVRDQDVYWCTADVGWVTGHSYVVYGPLAAGATVLIYEGAPTYPDAGRFWKLCQTHGVSIFYTAPTAIRALMKVGDAVPAQYDLSRLRLLGSVGEPINPEAWMWFHRVIGGARCPIVDTWWQTETGAIMISPLPGVTVTKPGSCTQPLPGIFADIVDDRGKSVTRAGAGGYLVVRKPWPSLARTIWGDNDRYIKTYWERFKNRFYVAGDGANRDADGYFWIVGRIDDVLNVAGHRLGTMEIESALVAHPKVAEAAVVGRPHEVKGESVFAYVVCRGERPTAEASKLIEELRGWVAQQLSPIAKPDDIRFADALPKTRSGKIMRRLLRAIARGEEISQDISTLENPAIVAQLRGEAVAAAHSPKGARRSTTNSARKPGAVASQSKAGPSKASKRAARKAPAARTVAGKAAAARSASGKKSSPRGGKRSNRRRQGVKAAARTAARPVRRALKRAVKRAAKRASGIATAVKRAAKRLTRSRPTRRRPTRPRRAGRSAR
jgi:acetyl-CoA synthetase